MFSFLLLLSCAVPVWQANSVVGNRPAHFFELDFCDCHWICDFNITGFILNISKNICKIRIFERRWIWTKPIQDLHAFQSMIVGRGRQLQDRGTNPDSIICSLPFQGFGNVIANHRDQTPVNKKYENIVSFFLFSGWELPDPLFSLYYEQHNQTKLEFEPPNKDACLPLV